MCCGVGLSTRALEKSFHDAESVVGIDTSPEMIAMARAISGHESGFGKTMTSIKTNLIKILGKLPHKGLVKRLFRATSQSLAKEEPVSDGLAQFVRGHAERTKLPNASIDLVTIMYVFS
jgi:ubiquinone/menaquinone biosynthesis C-methylase UbiE